MAKRIGAIIDCDGVLLDSIHAWHEAEVAIAAAGNVTLSKQQRDEINTLTLEEVGAYFHEKFGIYESAEAVVQAINDFMLNFYRTRAVPCPGAFDFVRGLHDAGVPMCVVSSSPQEFLQAGFERAGMLEFLPHIVSVDDVNIPKRDVRIYEYVANLMDVALPDIWCFDDSYYALEAMREAGCHTVGVFSSDACGTHEELAANAELVIDDFTELSCERFLAMAQ